MPNPGKLVLIIGPSGVGKSVILKSLRERHPELHFPKSATTRERREGEGTELYHFVSDDAFDALKKEQKMLEWAVVHGGARYGTMINEIVPAIDAGKVVVREVDVQGFDNIRTHELFRGEHAAYRMESVFILPESSDQLLERITSRAPISEQELHRRIASMESELSYASACDHQIVNREGELGKTIEEMESFLINN